MPIDSVPRLQGCVRESVADLGSHSRHEIQRSGEFRVLVQFNFRIGQCGHPPDHSQHQAVTQDGVALSRQHPQNRALECIAGVESRHSVLPQSRSNPVQEFVCDARTRSPDPPDIHAKARIVGRAEFPRGQGDGCAAKNFLNVYEGTNFASNLGQLQLEVMLQIIGQWRFQEARQLLRTHWVRIEAEHNPADLFANALHCDPALGGFHPVRCFEIGLPEFFIAFETEENRQRVTLLWKLNHLAWLTDIS